MPRDGAKRILAVRVREPGPATGVQLWRLLARRALGDSIDHFRRGHGSTDSAVRDRGVSFFYTLAGRHGRTLEKTERKSREEEDGAECAGCGRHWPHRPD